VAFRADERRCLFDLNEIDIADNNLCAGLCESKRKCASVALACSSDKGEPAVE
jgi:hypothetical protein